MNTYFKKLSFVFFLCIFSLHSCGIYKKTDARKIPTNANDRIKKNVEEGRGFRLGNLGKSSGGDFQFASSNPLWRATLEKLDFAPLNNVDYAGGIIVTDWFSEGNTGDQIKITVRFLTNQVRADALDVSIHERKCQKSFSDCNVKKIQSKLENEIKLAILKRAAFLGSNQFKQNREEFLKEKRAPRSLDNTK